jgi:murein hydrolase activator
MMQHRPRRLAACLVALAALAPAFAQTGNSQVGKLARDTFSQDDLRAVEKARDAAQKRLKSLEKAAGAAEREVADIDADLITAAADSRRREEAAADAEARLADLDEQVIAARAALSGDQAALEDLLAALMTFGAHRPPALAASPEDTGAAIRAAILMGETAPALSMRAKDLKVRIDTLNALTNAVTHERETLGMEEEALTARRDEIEALAAEKRLSRTSLATQTAAARAETERLAAEAETLRELLDGLAATAPSTPGIKPTGPTLKPKMPKPSASAKPKDGSPGAPSAVAPGSKPRDLPSASSASASRPGAPSAAPLAPAVGQVVRKFGDKSDGTIHPGLTLQTRAGAQVVAPLDARVQFSGVFRTYGQMLILDVGGDMLVVVSGLNALYPEAGQWVLAGEPIGRMADQKSPAPELYLEVRRNGQTIDPAKWLGRGA